MGHPYLDGPYPRAYAHRGWHVGGGPENTLAGFTRAVDEGFSYLEFDVHASADSVAVVHHDPTLDRTTDGSGRISALDSREIAAVRVGGTDPVPLLADVLTALPETRCTIEMKSAAAVDVTLPVLERLDAWHRVCLGAYDERWLHRARRAAGPKLCTSMGQTAALGLRTRAWLDALPAPLSSLPALPFAGQLAQLPRRFGPLTVVDEQLVRTAHAAGREVHVWTVDDPAEMVELLDMGVDGVLSDRPDLLREVLRDRGAWA
ncbi:glycerophosphodiester phosphodiesterase family protein [Pseudonocardia abyssalis]|uniref:Glycerophosphodiester phosphodiesterase n=1 Tax=Pseudonocardia abyssalis TaxID=2792008 RepID=A0ABS6UPD6_9PSEU|nr:glycerophosphodiester phosphodiesterase family protein [Pseudonocardia abyssalis]MBW0116862.1 glycerophosphodiester phosphodiesterase [Pseudonocardia abyssalis]MBW0134122.1 glycerophosphodiester phosphodiesterase [Pseudonocardia abyssalis]